jgi:hypothetical protein
MANTYTAIADTLVGAGGASTITFSSIPQTYNHLVIMLSGRGSSGVVADSELRINNVAGDSHIGFELNGTVAVYGTSGSIIKLIDSGPSSTSGMFSNNYILIPNYTSSTFKQVTTQNATENMSNSAWQAYIAARRNTTSAVTSIVLVPGGGTYAQHSRATLYGIKNTI